MIKLSGLKLYIEGLNSTHKNQYKFKFPDGSDPKPTYKFKNKSIS